MSVLADVFAAVRLQLDGTGFEAQATALADKSGKNVGDRMSKNLNASLKSAALGLGGAAIGAAFGVMLTGANELDAATRQLQADTGMTGEEAKKAASALASMYRGNLQGFDAIGAAMAKVHNDLGLTGDAADVMTAQFLKFATATGIDAAAAVAFFDDILDAWNLTAGDAGTVMDKLIVSHQKFGGVISESASALAEMAPAMQAANMTIDDGIALLNLFNASGIEAAKAPTMLAKAVKQLKPGQDINDLIAQIGAIEDPTLRAQKAMEIFGAKTGVGMAQAIRPGMVSLDELTATLGDTTDATTDAADAIESSFGNQFKLLLKNAGGALADFGTQFGGLATIIGVFGPAVTTKLTAALGGLAGIFGPKLLAMILPQAIATGTTAGTAAGTAFGTALTAAAAIAAVAVPVTIILAAQGPVADFLGLSGKQTGPAGTWEPKLGGPFKTPEVVVPVQATPDEEASAEAFRKYLANLPAGVKGLNYSEWKKAGLAGGTAVMDGAVAGVNAGGPAVTNAAAGVGAEVPGAFAGGVRSKGGGSWNVLAEEVTKVFGTGMDDVRQAARFTGLGAMGAMADGITAARAAPVDAFDTMKEMLKNAMTPTQEAARLAGQLTSKELAAGLKSKDPAVKAQAIEVRRSIIDRLRDIKNDSGTIGGAAMDKLNEGMRSKESVIRSAAKQAKEWVTTELNRTAPAAQTAGANAGAAYVRGLLSRIPAFLRSAIEAQLHAAGVPGYALGSWFVPVTQLATVHAGEMIIPAAPATAVRSGQATVTAQGVTSRGQSINIEHVEIRDAHDEFSLIQSLRFLAAVG